MLYFYGIVSVNETYLVSQLSKGNKHAFEELYYMYAAAIKANITKWIKDPEAVHDLLQEVFIALWENRQNITPEKGIAPWLYTVSHNKSIKYLKKQITSEPLIDLPEEQDNEQDDLHINIIYEALDQLPERKKTAFLEYKLKGKSLDQVATEMGITKETVKGYLKDVRKSILEYMSTHQPSASVALILVSTLITIP
jgi:RNA polymerase sigma factor (sigma-70 family)